MNRWNVLKRAALCSISAFALAPSASAQYYKAPPAPVFTWTGFYVGGAVGYGHLKTEWRDVGTNFGEFWAGGETVNIPASGALFGALAGYNYQINQLVLGIETDISYLTGTGSTTWPSISVAGVFGTVDTKANWLGSTRARVGVAFNQFLVFATAGVAYGDPRAHWSQSTGAEWESSGWRNGFIWGGGIEYAVSSQFIVRVDAMHVQFKNHNAVDITKSGTGDFGATTGYVMQTKYSETVARLGAIFKF
jgi:outer membrane immunogenic protein